MSSLTAHSIPYPDPTDPLRDVAAALKALADELEAQLYTTSETAVTEVAGWLIQSQRLVRCGPFAYLDVVVQNNTGAAITFSSTGGATDVTVCALPAAWAPNANSQLSAGITWRATANTGGGYISTAGNVRISDGPPTASIPAGGLVGFTGVYLLLNI